MGRVIDLRTGRQRPMAAARGRFVLCAQCGERHPIVRLGDGGDRCVTAFVDGPRWFCRNRGCRAKWMTRRGRRDD